MGRATGECGAGGRRSGRGGRGRLWGVDGGVRCGRQLPLLGRGRGGGRGGGGRRGGGQRRGGVRVEQWGQPGRVRGEGVGGEEVLRGEEEGVVLIQHERLLCTVQVGGGGGGGGGGGAGVCAAHPAGVCLLPHLPAQAVPAADVQAGQEDADHGLSPASVDADADLSTSSSGRCTVGSASVVARRPHGQCIAGGSPVGVGQDVGQDVVHCPQLRAEFELWPAWSRVLERGR